MVFVFLILKRVDWTVLVQVFSNSLFSCKIVNMICRWWSYVVISNIAICRLQSRLSNFRLLLYSPEEIGMGSAHSYSTYQWVSSLVKHCWCVFPLWHTHITPTLASTCQSSVFEHFVWTIHNESSSTSDIIVTSCYTSQFETRRTDWQPETEGCETLVSIILNPPAAFVCVPWTIPVTTTSKEQLFKGYMVRATGVTTNHLHAPPPDPLHKSLEWFPAWKAFHQSQQCNKKSFEDSKTIKLNCIAAYSIYLFAYIWKVFVIPVHVYCFSFGFSNSIKNLRCPSML